MSKKSPNTTNTQIRSALRKLFLRSREHSARLKMDKYTCQRCGAKKHVSKVHPEENVYVEVHHKAGVEKWQELFAAIREYLLCDVEHLETLCKKCHKEEANE